MTSSDLGEFEPLPLLAAVGRRLDPDPSAVAQLCDRLPNNEIDRAGSVISRYKVLRELASRALGIAANTPQDDPVRPEDERIAIEAAIEAIKAEVKKAPKEEEAWKAGAVFASNRETRERLLRPRPENEKIEATIAAAIRDECAEVWAGKSKAFLVDPNTGEGKQIAFIRPPSLQRLLEKPIGEDVMIVRVRMQQEPEEIPVEEAPAEVAQAPDKPKRKNKGGRRPFDYKEEVINEAVKWLDYEGAQDQSKIIKFMRELIVKIDDGGGPCKSTMKNWAREALARFQRQRETIGQTPLSPRR